MTRPRPSSTRAARRDLVRNAVAAATLAAFVLAVDANAQAPSPTPRASRGATRIAVFDSRVVLDSMPQRSAAESEFALEQAKARTMLNAATDSLRAALDEFVRVEAQLSPRQREATAMHLRARELLVEEMAANLDHVILRRQAELQYPLREQVSRAVRAVRARAGYDLVLDRAADQVVVDADERIDITTAVLRELRAMRDEKDIARLPKLR